MGGEGGSTEKNVGSVSVITPYTYQGFKYIKVLNILTWTCECDLQTIGGCEDGTEKNSSHIK